MSPKPLLLLLLPILLAAATAPSDFYADSPDDFAKRPDLQTRIAKDAFNQPLLEAAIFHETNRQRAANKLPLFKHAFAAHLMARRHSTEMATLHYFEHTSPTPANRTLADRLKNVGLVGNISAGENIAVLPAKEMGSGRYIVTTNPDGTETLTDEATGKRIDYYTYDALAKAVVDQWMHSPAHRKNILDPRFLYLGVGAARGTYNGDQDSFYFTQNFSSTTLPASEKLARPELEPPTKSR